MLFGTWVTTIAGFGYIGVGAITGEAVWSGVPVAVWAFLTLRLLHGMSTGFRPTGTTAFLTDITPLNRRGEALGYLGVAGNASLLTAGLVLFERFVGLLKCFFVHFKTSSESYQKQQLVQGVINSPIE